MAWERARTWLAAVALACAAGAAGGEAIDGSVQVTGGSARFAERPRTGEARHRLQLRLQVSPAVLADLHDPAEDALRVVLGDTVLVEAAPGAEGYSPRRRLRWRWNGTAAGGRVRLSADGLFGTLRLRVSGADLGDLRDGDAQRIPVALDLAGSHLETTVSFRVRDGRTRRWLRPAPPIDPSPGPGPDPGPGPGPAPGPVTIQTLAQGMDSLYAPKVNTVVSTQSDWAAFWAKHQPGGVAPSVDFTKDVVIAAFLLVPTKTSQPNMTSTVRVASVTDSSTERRVVVEEVADGAVWTCPPPGVGAPCWVPLPYHFVSVPRTSLPTTFVLQ